MRNRIPTHYALTQAQVNKMTCFRHYAQSILTLIQHDRLDDSGDEFYTADKSIKTALSAVQYFLDEMEAVSQSGEYITLEAIAFQPNTAAKIAQIEAQRLAQTVKGGNDE